MEEIKLNMENLTKEEREQLLKLVEKANKKESKVWKPELNKVYYYIHDSGNLSDTIATVGDWTSSRYTIGNCFKTKEEAEFALEKQKVIVELERFAKENNPEVSLHQAFHLVCAGGKVKPAAFAGTITFTDIDVAQKAIDVIGENRLKKYYFGVSD